jgi:hypothetical protein
MIFHSNKFEKLKVSGSRGAFQAFDYLGAICTNILHTLKTIVEDGRNVFFTMAVKDSKDGTGLIPVMKGNVTLESVIGQTPYIIALHQTPIEENGITYEKPVIITSSYGGYQCRLGSMLVEDNPLTMAPNLTELIKFIQENI